jgi:vancomycin resistance protein VanJ
MLRHALIFVGFGGGLICLIFLALARLGNRQHIGLIELLDTFALYAFVLDLSGVALAATLLRSRLLLGLLIVGGLFFWQQFGHPLLPKPEPAMANGPGLRVLTYNKLFTNHDARPLAELAHQSGPDVIVVEESTDGYAQDLKRSLGDEYAFSVEGDGSAIFSRLPILATRAFRLWSGGYGLHQVRLVVGERTVLLYSVHLHSPQLSSRGLDGRLFPLAWGMGGIVRDQELELLIAEMSGALEPFILAGDFNTAAGSRSYRHFPSDWRDAFGERGDGLGHTWPTYRSIRDGTLIINSPLVRIDYVLSGRGVVPDRAWVPWVDGSDHLPVVADLYLPHAY